jgi:phosphoribosyl 1,2-cyclic phosphate phosphodiesterase
VRLTFLGTGTSTGVPVPTCDCAVCTSDDPRDRRLRPSVRIEWEQTSVLVDTATDLRLQALRNGLDRVDAVLYTHSHADHILGLDDLRIYKWRQRKPVPVYGSRRTLDDLARTFWYVFDGKPSESAKPEIEPIVIDAPFTLGGRTVIPVPLMHGTLPILGYRVGRLAYLTDASEIPESSYPLLADLDVLVLNALRDRPHPTHLTLDGAIERAARIGAHRTFLTHLCHEVHHRTVSTRLPDRVELAHDGLALDIEDDGDPSC